MAREMALAGVDPEDLKKSQAAPPPRSPREKWENYWYHYKWVTLGVAFLLLVGVIFTAQMLSRNEPDYTVLVVTEGEYSTYALAPMESLLESYGKDIDGDGEVEVRLATCHLGAKEYETASDQLLNYQILQSHLAAGDVMMFAFEGDYFGWFMGEMSQSGAGFLTPIGVQADGVSADGYYWSWTQDSRIKDNAAFDELPEELYFGVRVAAGTAAKRGEEQQQCLELLRALVEDTPKQKTK